MIGVGGVSREQPKARKRMRNSRMPEAERQAWERFRAAVCEYPCFLRVRDGNAHKCFGRKEAHHLLEKADIRDHFEGKVSDAELYRLLYAPVIGAPLCGQGHHLVTRHLASIHWEDLSPECIEFARGIDMENELRRSNPPREERT